MKKLLPVCTLILGLTIAALAEYAIGEQPPDFTCDDTHGGSWNLYEQHGKVVLLNFGGMS